MKALNNLCILLVLLAVSASALSSPAVEQFSGRICDREIDPTASSTTPESAVSSGDRLATILSLNEQLLKRLEILEHKITRTEVSNLQLYQNIFWTLNKAEISIKELKSDWDNLKGQLNHMNEKEAEPVTSEEFSEKFNELSNILTSTRLDVLRIEKELISTGQNITHLQSNVSALLGAAKQQPTYSVVQCSLDGAAAESCGVSSMLPQGCKEAQNHTGIIKVAPSGHRGTPFYVNCHNGWTIIQQREDGSINFNRSWSDYKHGFGNINGEFWIGLDKLHELTSSRIHELLIYLQDFEGETRTAKYDAFAIGGEEEKYALVLLGNYSGDAGDSLFYHAGQKFSTFDRDNDEWKGNCAKIHTGAWWYNACDRSNLNGRHFDRGEVSSDLIYQGIYWEKFKGGRNSFKKARMMIRPVD